MDVSKRTKITGYFISKRENFLLFKIQATREKVSNAKLEVPCTFLFLFNFYFDISSSSSCFIFLLIDRFYGFLNLWTANLALQPMYPKFSICCRSYRSKCTVAKQSVLRCAYWCRENQVGFWKVNNSSNYLNEFIDLLLCIISLENIIGVRLHYV